MAGLHTDGKGNVTYRAPMQNTADRFQYQQAPQDQGNYYGSYGQYGSGNPYGAFGGASGDPFSQFENAFGSIIPPQFGGGGGGSQWSPSNWDQMPQAMQQQQVPAQPTASSDPGLDAYRNFLRDQFIDPDTIGNAYIDRSSGKMIVPTAKQEYAAVNMKDRDNATEGAMLRAGATGAAREFNTYRGGIQDTNNFRKRVQFYINQILGRGNGFV